MTSLLNVKVLFCRLLFKVTEEGLQKPGWWGPSGRSLEAGEELQGNGSSLLVSDGLLWKRGDTFYVASEGRTRQMSGFCKEINFHSKSGSVSNKSCCLE